MRARNIKPGYFKSDELAELPALTRILFAGLWCVADRAGRLEDRPKRIKADVLPYDDCDVDAMLDQLAESGFVIRYETTSGRFIQVTNFDKHQNPHKNEASSSIEAPESHGTSTVQAPESNTTNPADSLIPDSLIPDTGLLEDGASAPEPPRPSEIALEVAESLITAPWVNDELIDVAREVDRLFGKVPDYNVRDGPAMAELYANWRGYRKKPPENWSMAWLKWLRKEVGDGQRSETNATTRDNHRPGRYSSPEAEQPITSEYRPRQPRAAV